MILADTDENFRIFLVNELIYNEDWHCMEDGTLVLLASNDLQNVLRTVYGDAQEFILYDLTTNKKYTFKKEWHQSDLVIVLVSMAPQGGEANDRH